MEVVSFQIVTVNPLAHDPAGLQPAAAHRERLVRKQIPNARQPRIRRLAGNHVVFLAGEQQMITPVVHDQIQLRRVALGRTTL